MLPSQHEGLRRADERQPQALCMCGLSPGSQLARTRSHARLGAWDVPRIQPTPPRAQHPSGAAGRAPFCSCQRWDTSCTCCLTCRSPCKHEKTTARRALAASLWKQHEDGLTFPVLARKRQKDSGSLHAVLRALLGHFPTDRFKALKPAG